MLAQMLAHLFLISPQIRARMSLYRWLVGTHDELDLLRPFPDDPTVQLNNRIP